MSILPFNLQISFIQTHTFLYIAAFFFEKKLKNLEYTYKYLTRSVLATLKLFF